MISLIVPGGTLRRKVTEDKRPWFKGTWRVVAQIHVGWKRRPSIPENWRRAARFQRLQAGSLGGSGRPLKWKRSSPAGAITVYTLEDAHNDAQSHDDIQQTGNRRTEYADGGFTHSK
ncbi:hypothetical protein LshimejAT787_1001830 [Lyophyllum shimeji]|uniref:Uncharacterized protein n=1 Tax=Lyophyllum shimeji TaxID=47721 RepID=A0A9P3PU16_LYOSH|nr:hypothetical protein LshimejAT787_1001830 [Lyophyllum shimeji]